uniref:Dynamin N-terminal domain-containing protein n=1 Tax=Melanopsichium pennsylvanicum 4 TaxID=1398559 RepID=A0A077R605_9BASI|nr:conserved hypothetical protein [Melanopsichium pennsylvanicum 4]
MSIEELEDAEDDPNSPLPTFFPAGARLVLSIRAPGAEPLRFTDLPGLISEGSDAEVNAIRKMIIEDVSQRNVIIVLIASLAMDIRHQNAFSLVKGIDPEGNRTMGVLTMPDRMPPGAERQWSKIINESSSENFLHTSSEPSNKLRHGWHVVRCPAQNEDRCNIVSIEKQFFHSETDDAKGPWHKMAGMLDAVGDHGDQDFVQARCGLDRLYCHLSELLLQQIREGLPKTIASALKLSEKLTTTYVNLVSPNNVGPHLSLNGPTFASQKVWMTIESHAACANSKQVHGQLMGSASSQRNAMRGFSTSRRLIHVVDVIVKHLHFSSVSINNALVPRLLHELHAMAPVYLPLTALEARKKDFVAVYKPRPWSFHCVMNNGVTAVRSGVSSYSHCDEEEAHDHVHANEATCSSQPSARAAAKQLLPKKKPINIDELVSRLTSCPIFNKAATFMYNLEQTRSKYDQLCSDILVIADEFVQSRVINDMYMLANRASDHSLAENRPSGSGGVDIDEGLERSSSLDSSEYTRWVAAELPLASSALHDSDPWLHTALKLMASLRGDFGSISLFVAREAQRVPVTLMKDLQSYLRGVVETFGDDLGEEQVYERYFYEVDRPRRE